MNSPSISVSRRRFLQTAAAAGALGFPAISRGQNAGQKLRLAIIGCGGRGAGDMAEVMSEEIVALCDVNANNLRAAAQRAPGAKQFRDFRQMYDALKDSEFDGVVVATTEHTHAFATLPALKRKKHVFCEKPLTRDVREARLITQAAKAAGVATQMGTQIHATTNYRRVVELVQSGAIGPVRECHVWVGRAWGLQSAEEAKAHGDIVSVLDRPAVEEPVPPELDWDLWIGPAPMRPYHSVYFPGPKWYRWWDFGNGTMSDLGSHWNDLPFWALKLQAPLTIEAGGPPPHPEIAPASMHATYEYGARGDMPPVRLTWHQGEDKPEIWTAGGIPQWDSGVLFIGTNGRMLLSGYDKHLLLPEKDFADFKRPEPFIPKSLGHHAEWIHACKTGDATTCNFQYAGWLTEANHLGNVAYRAGQKLVWDSAKLRATNTRAADKFIRREYRKGWKLA